MIGDIIPTQALAHVAWVEGITCVEKIKGLHTETMTMVIFQGVHIAFLK